jgi:hypothetical protein
MKTKKIRQSLMSLALLSISYCAIAAEATAVDAGPSASGSPNVTSSSPETGLFADAKLGGGVYYWGRHRVRKDVATGEFEDNLTHTSANANLDFTSGYFADTIGFDVAAFAAIEFSDAGPAYPNEIGLSEAETRWDEKWVGDRGGVNLYKAAIKVKSGDLWARGGYIQPSGQTLLAPHWSFMPGTYQGLEAGGNFDFDASGALSASYMIADAYKAPWYTKMYNFRESDGLTEIDYLHSLGMKYDFKNNFVLESAIGQAKNYMDQYFLKASYKMPVEGNDLSMSYQFYGAQDKVGTFEANDVYDGMAWLQAMTFAYKTGPLSWRLEGTWAKADGPQGYFLQRMTPSYASSNGRLDIWWDARSDFNANGEKAGFAGVTYDLGHVSLSDWTVGFSYAYGTGAKPSSTAEDQSTRLTESAWNSDITYTIPRGKLKGTSFKLHYTDYDNHTDIPSWSGGYGNIFQDEKDIKFIVIAPVNIF